MEANEILPPEHGGFLMRTWRRYRRYSGSHLLEKCCHDLDWHQALLGSRMVKAASFGGRGIFIPEHQTEMETIDADGSKHYQHSGRLKAQPVSIPIFFKASHGCAFTMRHLRAVDAVFVTK